jgi:hypothetical protein
MSLTASVEAAVEQAFFAAGDLVKTGVLTEETTNGFSFASGTLDSNESNYSLQFIEISSVLDKESNTVKELIVRTKDLDGSRYSTIVFNNQTYRFQKLEEYTGITKLTVRSVPNV